MTHKSIITGISGQDGAYLAQLLLEKGHDVIGIIRQGLNPDDDIVNLKKLGIQQYIHIIPCDLCSYSDVKSTILKSKVDEIYNLAAQSSVATSFSSPYSTLSFNINSVLNIVEVIYSSAQHVKLYQASSSDMFGQIPHLPITEDMAFHPLSPYAVSKAAAHWIAKNYRESYGLFISCGILFNHESPLRGNNFFVKKVISQAVDIYYGIRDHIKVGNLDVKRDFGYSPRYVEAMYLMLQQSTPSDYLICSGKSISLREIINYVFHKLQLSNSLIREDSRLYRPLDIPNIYGSNKKAKQELGWKYDIDFKDVLDLMIEEEKQCRKNQ